MKLFSPLPVEAVAKSLWFHVVRDIPPLGVESEGSLQDSLLVLLDIAALLDLERTRQSIKQSEVGLSSCCSSEEGGGVHSKRAFPQSLNMWCNLSEHRRCGQNYLFLLSPRPLLHLLFLLLSFKFLGFPLSSPHDFTLLLLGQLFALVPLPILPHPLLQPLILHPCSLFGHVVAQQEILVV